MNTNEECNGTISTLIMEVRNMKAKYRFHKNELRCIDDANKFHEAVKSLYDDVFDDKKRVGSLASGFKVLPVPLVKAIMELDEKIDETMRFFLMFKELNNL